MSVEYMREYGVIERRLKAGLDVVGVSARDFEETYNALKEYKPQDQRHKCIVTTEMVTVPKLERGVLKDPRVMESIREAHASVGGWSSQHTPRGALREVISRISGEKSVPRFPHTMLLGSRALIQDGGYHNVLCRWDNGHPGRPYHKVALTDNEKRVGFTAGEKSGNNRCLIESRESRVSQAIICRDLLDVAVGGLRNVGASAPSQSLLLHPEANSLLVSSCWAANEAVPVPGYSREEKQANYQFMLEEMADAAFGRYGQLQDIVVIDGGYSKESDQKPFNAYFTRHGD